MNRNAIDPMHEALSRLSFLSGPLPPAFTLRVVVVDPGRARGYDPTEWRRAIVVVEHGTIELEWLGGSRRCFHRGDVLHLDGPPLRHLYNPGRQPAVLAAVTRPCSR